MLTIDDVFAMEMAPGRFHQLTVTGFFVIFKDVAYLCRSDEQRKPAILVDISDLPQHVLARLPIHAASTLTRAGTATLAGSISKIAQQPFDYSMVSVRSLSFRDSNDLEAQCRLR